MEGFVHFSSLLRKLGVFESGDLPPERARTFI